MIVSLNVRSIPLDSRTIRFRKVALSGQYIRLLPYCEARCTEWVNGDRLHIMQSPIKYERSTTQQCASFRDK